LRLPAEEGLVIPPLSGVVLPLNAPLKPRGRLVYSTAEVLDLSSNQKGLWAAMSAAPGRRIAIALDLPRKPRAASAGGRRVKTSWDGRRATISFTAAHPETDLRLTF
jgi:hypothetical protein